MDLSDTSLEAAASWLSRSVESDIAHQGSLLWRIPTQELVARYGSWVRATRFRAATKEELWEIIQLLYPWVSVIGLKGNTAFTALRWRQSPPEEPEHFS